MFGDRGNQLGSLPPSYSESREPERNKTFTKTVARQGSKRWAHLRFSSIFADEWPLAPLFLSSVALASLFPRGI